MKASALRPLAVIGVTALGLTACSNAEQSSAEKSGSGDRIQVVTPTNVYADIVEQIGGDRVEAKPLIESSAQDPHSYEASAADRLTVQDADLVIVNGGGYDAFLEDLAEQGDAPVIDVVDAADHDHAGHDHEGEEHDHDAEESSAEASAKASEEAAEEASEAAGEGHSHSHHHGHDHSLFNEHLWYDLHAMNHLSDAIEEKLAEMDSAHAQEFKANAEEFEQKLGELEQRAYDLPGEGKSYLATEAVSAALLDATGMENLTPSGYVEAIEHGDDAPAAAVRETQDLMASGRVDLLSVNPQTASAQTEQLEDSAREHSVPSLEFTETIPEGQSYLEWMTANLDQTEKVLKG